jgi:hypothetical protein
MDQSKPTIRLQVRNDGSCYVAPACSIGCEAVREIWHRDCEALLMVSCRFGSHSNILKSNARDKADNNHGEYLPSDWLHL